MFKIGVIIMALSSTIFANWFTNLFDPTPTPTIKIPVDLTKVGTIVDMEFRVNYDESTRFVLDFECKNWKLDDGLDCKKMRKFIGLNGYSGGTKVNKVNYEEAKGKLGDLIDENYNFDGTKVPLKITLRQVTDNGTFITILDKTYNTKGMGNSDGTRDIISEHLKKGKYKLKVENLKDFSELKDRPIKLKIQSTYRK